jgi:hypothetical protein
VFLGDKLRSPRVPLFVVALGRLDGGAAAPRQSFFLSKDRSTAMSYKKKKHAEHYIVVITK